MKIKVLVWLAFLVCTFSMKAQEKLSVDFNLKTESTEKINFNQANARLFISKKIDDKNEITNTTSYTNLKVKYEAGTYDYFENLNQFNRIENKFEISHKISDATKLNLALTPTLNFQQNLGISDLNVLGSFQLNQQLNSKIALHIGFERSTIFGLPKFMPSLSFSGKINNQSSLLIGFPNSKISYSNNERNTFSLSNSFNGSFYNLDKSLALYNTAAKISTSQMTTALEYERNMDKNWFINFKAGYDFDKKYNLLDENNHKLYDFNTGDGYILSIGIKYKQ
ncbi:DUF6268 family outer membrane beta-barrel protein [Flavobacterium pectinovorum]|uniref:DUF6268 family outer membrane beta-barrel protein n=1 Tax=Flavobacterium pectinovorum TaxID=29533 RepID=UPI001FAB6890|nr:DUF6268 family outer membrane beta-barrel protein [Flavobacterium pectinovorum]MCI9843167.1 hypothetical protein [Flavobacterium pectinovorum]